MTYVHRMIDEGRREGELKGRREGIREGRQIGRQIGIREGELRGQLQTIQGFLGRDVPWSTIEAATGIDEATFRRLKQQFDDNGWLSMSSAPVTALAAQVSGELSGEVGPLPAGPEAPAPEADPEALAMHLAPADADPQYLASAPTMDEYLAAQARPNG